MDETMMNPPKKRKTGLILGIIALVVAAAIGAGLFFTMNTPAAKLAKAAKKTEAALTQQVGSFDHLKAILEACQFPEEGPKAGKMTVDIPAGERTVGLEMDMLFGPDAAQYYLSLDLGGSTPLTGQFEMTPDSLRLSLPQFWPDRVFVATGEDLGLPEGAKLYSRQIPDRSKNQEVLAAYVKGLSFEELGQKAIAGETWDAYAVKEDPAAREKLAEVLEEALAGRPYYSYTRLTGSGDQLDEAASLLDKISDGKVYVNKDGYLCGISVVVDDSYTVMSRLVGKDNPWSTIEILKDEDVLFTVNTSCTDGTLNIELGFADDDAPLCLSYRDADATLTATSKGDDSDKVTISLSSEPGKLDMNMLLEDKYMDESLPINFSFFQELEIPAMPEGTETRLMDLIEGDSTELLEELQKNLMRNPSLMGMFLGLGL